VPNQRLIDLGAETGTVGELRKATPDFVNRSSDPWHRMIKLFSATVLIPRGGNCQNADSTFLPWILLQRKHSMSDVKPIPEGFSSVTPYMIVSNSVEAIAFYGKAFGATEISRMEGPGGSTMHAEIRIGNAIVMMTDENPQFNMSSPLTLGNTTGSLHLYVEDVDAAFQAAIDAGCEVVAPLMDMFWGDRFGKVKDPFGHTWSLATKQKNLTREEVDAGAAIALKQMQSGEFCEPTE
jgi:uncharacterized glyoxalase superfamily protein PhnB